MIDTKFMSAEDKRKVLRDWDSFLRLGIERKRFTKRLYHHLTQHCSFIAHFDRNGFYDYYFVHPERTILFLSQFDRNHPNELQSVEYSATWWLTDRDYSDINQAMCDIATEYAPHHYAKCYDAARQRDLAEAKRLLTKWEEPK
jgi:hypothetical protein